MGNAPHMSYNKIKLRNEIKVNDEHGVPNEFRASGYIQFKTDWNDTLGRPQPMTEAQQKICDELADKMLKAGVEISVTLSKVEEGARVQDFKKVAAFQMRMNTPRESQGQTPVSAPVDTPSAPLDQPVVGTEGQHYGRL